MRKLKLISAALMVLGIFYSVGSMAQPMHGGQGRMQMSAKEMAKKQTDWMKGFLDLTKEQLTQIEKINLKYAEKLQAQRQSAMGNRDTMQSLMTKLTREKDEELKKVLTEDQYALLAKKRKETVQNRRGGMGRGY